MEIIKERTGIEKKFYDLSKQIVEEQGYVLYDLDYISGSSTLRVYIMDSTTKTAIIEDCVKVDHAFTEHVEDAQWVPDSLVLEVSSPGMYRSLKEQNHFELALDQQVQIQLKTTLGEVLEGAELDKKTSKARKFVAILKEVNSDSIKLELDSEFELILNYKDIKKANLEPEV